MHALVPLWFGETLIAPGAKMDMNDVEDASDATRGTTTEARSARKSDGEKGLVQTCMSASICIIACPDGDAWDRKLRQRSWMHATDIAALMQTWPTYESARPMSLTIVWFLENSERRREEEGAFPFR